jgi:hypothetical protein
MRYTLIGDLFFLLVNANILTNFFIQSLNRSFYNAKKIRHKIFHSNFYKYPLYTFVSLLLQQLIFMTLLFLIVAWWI